MTHSQDNTQMQAALLRNNSEIDTPVKNGLCCAAAGIIASSSSATAEALIPHKKLREAAKTNATLIARNRPLAQPVLGYMRQPPTHQLMAKTLEAA